MKTPLFALALLAGFLLSACDSEGDKVSPSSQQADEAKTSKPTHRAQTAGPIFVCTLHRPKAHGDHEPCSHGFGLCNCRVIQQGGGGGFSTFAVGDASVVGENLRFVFDEETEPNLVEDAFPFDGDEQVNIQTEMANELGFEFITVQPEGDVPIEFNEDCPFGCVDLLIVDSESL